MRRRHRQHELVLLDDARVQPHGDSRRLDAAQLQASLLHLGDHLRGVHHGDVDAGIALTNLVRLPTSTAAGLGLAPKKLLHLGIVFLGLPLARSDIVPLDRVLRMAPAQVLVIACGSSICGSAAAAGVEGVTDAEEE